MVARLQNMVRSNKESSGRETEKPCALDPHQPRRNYFSFVGEICEGETISLINITQIRSQVPP